MKNSKQLILTLIILLTVTASIAQQIVGYAPYYRSYASTFDFSKYTHVHYFAIWPAADGSFIYPQGQDSLSMLAQYNSIASKAQPQGVKMVITFGGTSANGSKHFPEMAQDPVARAAFVSNAIELCNTWNIDGIDVDWEWETHEESTEHKDAYTALLTDLRVVTTSAGLSLSTDVPASSWFGANSDADAVGLCDYVNVMSYEYNGSWAPSAKHHSPLSSTISLGLNYWEGRGISRGKLNIGIPFYSYLYSGTTTPGSAYTDVTKLNYAQVKALILSGYTVVEDNNAGTYCYSVADNKIVFYDSPTNINNKFSYAKNNNYSGVIIWEIGQDDNQELSSALTSVLSVSSEINKKDNFVLFQKDTELIIQVPGGSFEASIFDLEGQQLKEGFCASAKYVMPIDDLKLGVYIVTIRTNMGLFSRKIYVQ